jgi:hypothetical protein
MIIVKKETGRIAGRQSIVNDNGQHYLVGSINNSAVNKTYIVKCSPEGKVRDWNEVYTVSPANHDGTLEALENGMITKDDFNFVD